MIVFLHSNNPRNIVKSYSTKTEISVIRDFSDFFYKGIEVWCRDAVDGCDEVCGGEAILI